MENLFFLEPCVAGRSGPDKSMWDIEKLKCHGVSAILSVNDAEMVHASRIKALGIVYAHIPLSSNAPPLKGDLETCLKALPQIVKFIECHSGSGIVVVHCRSGKDRTGLALAAYLIKSRGYSALEAIETIKNVRSIAFTAPNWEEFAKTVLGAFQKA